MIRSERFFEPHGNARPAFSAYLCHRITKPATDMKKVLIISSSLRARSNSEALAEAFARGAAKAGNEVELITLREKDIRFCRGCLACQKSLRCVIADDAPAIVERMRDADVIAFATPIYYYEMSGQLKTLLDRANPLYASDYRFRDIFLLSSAAEDEAHTPERAVTGLTGWIDCFGKARLAGTVFAGGVNGPGEMEGHPSLDLAYDAGRRIR